MGGVNQGGIYLGLFLIAFGLYAAQLKKNPKTLVNPRPVSVLVDSTPIPLPQTRIELLYEEFAHENLIVSGVDGVSIIPKLGAPKPKSEFSIILSGDEIYEDGAFAIHESWESFLDRMADAIRREKGLKIEISGYADDKIVREKKATDYGASGYAFSYARAEWLAHYFERKHGIEMNQTFILRGMGPVAKGKKIELRFYYSRSFNVESASGAD